MTPSFQGCLYWSLAQIRPGEDVLVEEEVDEEVDHHRYFFYNFKSDPVAMILTIGIPPWCQCFHICKSNMKDSLTPRLAMGGV